VVAASCPPTADRGRQLWQAPLVPIGQAHDTVTAGGERYRIRIAPRLATAQNRVTERAVTPEAAKSPQTPGRCDETRTNCPLRTALAY
jgi:hypothetical protein